MCPRFLRLTHFYSNFLLLLPFSHNYAIHCFMKSRHKPSFFPSLSPFLLSVLKPLSLLSQLSVCHYHSFYVSWPFLNSSSTFHIVHKHSLIPPQKFLSSGIRQLFCLDIFLLLLFNVSPFLVVLIYHNLRTFSWKCIKQEEYSCYRRKCAMYCQRKWKIFTFIMFLSGNYW